MNLIEELRWRGLIQDIMPGTEEQLLKERTSGYIGFDPTADSLHIGNLVAILLLVRLQRAGHKPIALVGGATGMVGDPSGKSAERSFLDEDVLKKNQEGVRRQLEKFLDFSPSLPNAAEMVNNYDWFKGISFLQFIREAGKHITVNYMMSKESVRKRIEGESGISFTEFTYQLIQGYDYYWLYTHKGVKLQMGGSDQWGNITTGTELIRRKAGGEAFALTAPLITKSDGSKFGKSEGGNIWLDPEKTSPYQFYQFWVRAADADAERWIRIFTFLSKDEIDALIAEHHKNEAERVLQKRLAKELTLFVHGEEGFRQATETTEKLFAQQSAPAESMSVSDLEGMEGIVRLKCPRARLSDGVDAVSLLAETGVFPSKGEARKMIANGGVSINRHKLTDAAAQVTEEQLLHGRFMLIQKGRRNYFLLEAE